MPEYGRNVQRMVEHALTIKDKQQRTECVQTIMRTMENLFPYLKTEESRHKMYDHLAMMSGFRLDIDSPYHRPSPEELRYNPEPLSYNTIHPIHYRHYGRIVSDMIGKAIAEQDPEQKKQLIVAIANRMKQNYIVWNKDHVDAERIKEDITALSNGQLNCDFPEFQLAHAWQLSPQNNNQSSSKKKKKKKKNQ